MRGETEIPGIGNAGYVAATGGVMPYGELYMMAGASATGVASACREMI